MQVYSTEYEHNTTNLRASTTHSTAPSSCTHTHWNTLKSNHDPTTPQHIQPNRHQEAALRADGSAQQSVTSEQQSACSISYQVSMRSGCSSMLLVLLSVLPSTCSTPAGAAAAAAAAAVAPVPPCPGCADGDSPLKSFSQSLFPPLCCC